MLESVAGFHFVCHVLDRGLSVSIVSAWIGSLLDACVRVRESQLQLARLHVWCAAG